MRYYVALLLLLASCASFHTPRPMERLCNRYPTRNQRSICQERVKTADSGSFIAAEEAVYYGLAYALETYPKQVVIGAVYQNPDTTYHFIFFSVGTEKAAYAEINSGVEAYFHTQPDQGGCTNHDGIMRLHIDGIAGRHVPYYVQHRLGDVEECRAPKK